MAGGFDPAKAANPTERRILQQADNMDLRYRVRIQNQVDSINRLLKDGTYTTEMLELHEVLAEQGFQLQRIREALAEYDSVEHSRAYTDEADTAIVAIREVLDGSGN